MRATLSMIVIAASIGATDAQAQSAVEPNTRLTALSETGARNALAAAGYDQISALTQDWRGNWRGRATKAGHAVVFDIAPNGNIVAAREPAERQKPVISGAR